MIIDTKWKIPENNKPTDSDLKQMYIYNEYWKSRNAITTISRSYIL
jgi:5-methylcytosine-specific restriction enzyme subunit McrC